MSRSKNGPKLNAGDTVRISGPEESSSSSPPCRDEISTAWLGMEGTIVSLVSDGYAAKVLLHRDRPDGVQDREVCFPTSWLSLNQPTNSK